MTRKKHSVKIELDENFNETCCAIGCNKPEIAVKIQGEPHIYDLANIVRAIFINPASPMTRQDTSLQMLALVNSESYKKKLVLALAKSKPRFYIALNVLKEELDSSPKEYSVPIQNITGVINLFASRKNMLGILKEYEISLIAFFIEKYYLLLSSPSRELIKDLMCSKGFPRVFKFQYGHEQAKKMNRLTTTGFVYAAPIYGSSFMKAVGNIYRRMPNEIRNEIEKHVKSIEQCDFNQDAPCVDQTKAGVFNRAVNYRSGL